MRAHPGSRGFTGLRRFLVGSVSTYIVESEVAPCLVVRSSLPRLNTCAGAEAAESGPSEASAAAAFDAAPPPDEERGRVVGIAVDGTTASSALVQWARQVALRPTDKVTIVHGRADKPKARPRGAAAAVAGGPLLLDVRAPNNAWRVYSDGR